MEHYKQDIRLKVKQLQRELIGHYHEVAVEANVSHQTVYRVLSGKYVNMDVISAAIRVRDRKRSEIKQVLKKI